MSKRNICILGSTGSIGENTLDVIARNPDRYRVVALAARQNTKRLAEQCARFGADLAVIGDPSLAPQLAGDLERAGSKAEIMAGDELVTAQKDDLIVVPKGHKRGVKALSELTLLHVVQPPPEDKDHNKVRQKLAEGKFE